MVSSCVIVGGGISGLVAASEIRKKGKDVTILEEAGEVGGRMATRRTETGVFDHGVQFITVRTKQFETFVRAWQEQGLLKRWTQRFADLRPGAIQDDYARYMAAEGMSSVPGFLAEALDVRLRTRAISAERLSNGWLVKCESGEEFRADALILTPPLPQTLALLDSGGATLVGALEMHLRAIAYNACIAVLVELDGPGNVPPPGGMHLGPEPIRWIADNRTKGLSPSTTCLTIHAGPRFSEEYFDAPSDQITGPLLAAAAPFAGAGIRSVRIHRWKYSEPRFTFPQRALLAEKSPPLVLAGDAFGGPRVEGAVLSGVAAAEILLNSE